MLISYLYDVILIVLKVTSVFGHYIEIKAKNKIDIVWQFSST